jgi:hypothetical protein
MADDPQTDATAGRFEVRMTADTHFGWLRTRVSVERTLMSWVRTAVSLIGFGFAIVQFFERMQAMPGVKPAYVIDGMTKLGILDDTLVYYIIGDNGASAEGTLQGAYNEMANFNGLAALETPEFLMERYEKLGGPESYNHYAVGWAHAMCSPYQWTKQVASHWGGTRNGTVVHWPNGIKAKDEIRSQSTMLSMWHRRFLRRRDYPSRSR